MKVEEVISLAERAGLPLPKWNWPELKIYKGFTHEQRVRGWQAEKLAIRMGLLTPSSEQVCRECGGNQTMQYHSNDYSTLEGLVPLCQRCHIRLHRQP